MRSGPEIPPGEQVLGGGLEGEELVRAVGVHIHGFPGDGGLL